jgi:hypothetical protein
VPPAESLGGFCLSGVKPIPLFIPFALRRRKEKHNYFIYYSEI